MIKKIGNFIRDIIIGIWLIIAIFVTICLLSYNDFKVSTFGKNSLLIIDSDEMEPEFYEGDLLIVKRNSDSKINVGDKVFFYNSALNSDVWIYNGTVTKKTPITRDETTFSIDDEDVSGEYIIGKVDGAKVIHKMGSILKIFTSKWGYMFLVIFPTLFAIIYEIMMVIETRKQLREDKKNEE